MSLFAKTCTQGTGHKAFALDKRPNFTNNSFIWINERTRTHTLPFLLLRVNSWCPPPPLPLPQGRSSNFSKLAATFLPFRLSSYFKFRPRLGWLTVGLFGFLALQRCSLPWTRSQLAVKLSRSGGGGGGEGGGETSLCGRGCEGYSCAVVAAAVEFLRSLGTVTERDNSRRWSVAAKRRRVGGEGEGAAAAVLEGNTRLVVDLTSERIQNTTVVII